MKIKILNIRTSKGDVTTVEGKGRVFKTAVTRLYNQAVDRYPRRYLCLDQFVPSEDGSPYGTHFIQFGHWNWAGNTHALDPEVEVHVTKEES